MSVILQMLWPAFAACAALGFGFGAVFGAGFGLPSATPAVRLAALATSLGIGAVAWSGIVPGRPGLWLDIAAACIASYAAGAILAVCARWALGWFSRSRSGAEPKPAA
jgi:hypothetical protein